MSYQYIGDELSAFRFASNWKRYWTSKVFEVVPINFPVIEIGSGIGGNFKPISKYTNRYIGVEPDPELVKISHTENPEATFFLGNLQSLKPSIDPKALLYIDVLEHIEDDALEMKHAENFLVPGSYLVVLVPAHMELYSSFDKSIGHFRRYSIDALMSIIPANFQVLYVAEIDSIGFALSYVAKKFRKSSNISPLQVKIWDSLIPFSKIIDKYFPSSGKSILLILRKH